MFALQWRRGHRKFERAAAGYICLEKSIIFCQNQQIYSVKINHYILLYNFVQTNIYTCVYIHSDFFKINILKCRQSVQYWKIKYCNPQETGSSSEPQQVNYRDIQKLSILWYHGASQTAWWCQFLSIVICDYRKCSFYQDSGSGSSNEHQQVAVFKKIKETL